jgi:hypothetical protein
MLGDLVFVHCDSQMVVQMPNKDEDIQQDGACVRGSRDFFILIGIIREKYKLFNLEINFHVCFFFV